MTAQVITECIRGHVFTEENTRRLKDGSRVCRACDRLRTQKYREPSYVPFPNDIALQVQIAYNAWIQAYEEYLQGRLKNTRLRRSHLDHINQLFSEYEKAEKAYEKAEQRDKARTVAA